MRGILIRILQAVVVLAVACSFANAGDDVMYVKKKVVAAAGGGPPAGTLLVGDNTAYAGTTAWPEAFDIVYDSEGYTAAASATVTTGYAYFSSGTGNFKILVYDSSKVLIGTSNSGTVAAGLRSVTFTGGPAITSGQTYYLGVWKESADGYLYTGSGTGRLFTDTTATDFVTPPDPLGGSQWAEIVYEIRIFVTN